jgi:hypothetical protein
VKPDWLAETNEPLGHYTREWGCGKILTFTVLSGRRRWLAGVARQELGPAATFLDGWNRFNFSGLPSVDATPGVYNNEESPRIGPEHEVPGAI